MTKLEERLKQLLSNFEPFNYGNSDDEQRDSFVEGFKAALEMPELMELEKAIVAGSHYLTFHSQGKGATEFFQMNEDAGKVFRPLVEWRSFIGQVDNEEKR